VNRHEGQIFSGSSLFARYASLVKLPHTLFALPFAGLGAVLASYRSDRRLTPGAVLWIAIAFTAARFAAMAFNRIVDRHYDARNPRTRQREIPSGAMSVRQAVSSVIVMSLVFGYAAWRLNPLCAALAPLALAWVFFYSYTKRFTRLAHHVLGLALGIAPVGGYLAISGEWSQPWYALPVLAAAVMFWVAGFDTIYSIQDIDFDRVEGLHSIAARLGSARAVALARTFHALAVALFLAIWALHLFPVGFVYLSGVGAMIGLLIYENWTVRKAEAHGLDLRLIDRAFFRANIAVSISLFALTLIDRLLSFAGPGA
jgi:4-hydroxybenzoate polyprenyltransferase